MTTEALIRETVRLIATACNDKHTRFGPAPDVPPDPQWKLHRAQALAAALGRDVCAFTHCLREAGDPGEAWCHRHAPDDVAIDRATRGEPVQLMTHERHEAIRLMSRRGQGWDAIQATLRVSGKTIARALSVEEDAA